MKLRSGLLATAMVLLLVAGCSKVVDGRAIIGAPRPGTPVQWSACDSASSADVKIPAGAECGMLSVPVDYAKPDGDVAQIAMVRFKATGNKIGSLIINPGGPGESGVQAAASIVGTMPDSIRERFDLVGFDPRGVGSSTPAVWCNSDADNDRLRADPQVDYSPAGVEHIESETRDFVQRCVDKMGKEFLANVGTASVVKDLDTMRTVLGDEKLTYLGYSYGTRIGSLYAERYPQNVRAMILDGAVDPNADPIEADIRQAAAFQKAFDDYAADCATKPSCPLGTDPSKAVDVYHSLIDPLVEKPAQTKDPRGLSYGDALVGTILPLYSPNLWRHLTQGLTELKSGDGDTMLALADLYMGRDGEGHYNNSTDVRVAVNCVDEPPVTERDKAVDEDRRAREAAPFMSYGEFTGHAPLSTCAFWPVPPSEKPHEISVKGLPPILVVSTTNDPATPYQAGVDLAKQLGGSVLTFEGTQHTVVFQGNPCVDDIAAKYLIDVTVPPPGARC
jgi:pimeloyl-ACP methyl ester carboxylesterase